MIFKIYSTSNGPFIIYDEKVLVLSEDDKLFELCEKDGSALRDIEGHILFELESAFSEYLGAVSSNIPAPVQKLNSYLSAVQQFLFFKNVKWPQYQTAIKEAEDE